MTALMLLVVLASPHAIMLPRHLQVPWYHANVNDDPLLSISAFLPCPSLVKVQTCRMKLVEGGLPHGTDRH